METQENINFKSTSFNFVEKPARIAVYDDLKAPPRIITIGPASTNIFIENLTSKVYEESQKKAGKIPYTVIRELCENFIHANFSEIVVSILDDGNTIRFTDQGPGFYDIAKSKLPGFTSATENMKKYIRGVGSGLPTACDYLTFSEGQIKIENNLGNGSVVTVSLLKNLSSSIAFSNEDKIESDKNYKERLSLLTPNLSEREIDIIKLLYSEGSLGVTQIHKLLEIPLSSVHKLLKNLEESNLVEKISDKKRILSDFGFEICKQF